MIRLIAIVISIILQFVAAIIAIGLTRRTKYRISWILVSAGFLFMAIKRLVDLYQYIGNDFSEPISLINDWLSVVIAIFLSIGVFIIPEIFNYLKRIENIRKIGEERVLNAVIQTEERERMRFAKDLHDGLGPLLSSLKLSVSALLQMERPKEDKEILKNADSVVNEAIKSIKEISNNLSPYVLEHFGLVSAVKSFTDKINENKLIAIHIDTEAWPSRLDKNTEVILYRTICELVNNTLRHSGAKNGYIRLNCKNNDLVIIYEDDGKGFDVPLVIEGNTSGMGLQNILSRIKTIDGSASFTSINGKGMQAVITVKQKAEK